MVKTSCDAVGLRMLRRLLPPSGWHLPAFFLILRYNILEEF